MKQSYRSGFTVIELLLTLVLIIGIGVLFFVQKANLESGTRDERRRTAINAMYYNLEDLFYKQNQYYPKSIDSKNLTAMDSALFTDPHNYKIRNPASDYRYEPSGCSIDNKCTGYSLRADLENEADFIKTNRKK